MTVKLQYELDGLGWATCTVEADGQQVKTSASYLSDALGDLTNAVASMLRGEPEATAFFAEEPGEYQWQFKRQGPDRFQVRILASPWLAGQGRGVELRPIFDVECPIRTFARVLVSELQRLLEKHGEAGYRELWVLYDFPLAKLQELQQLLAEEETDVSRPSA
jgi:hypothetical protein